MSGFLNILHLKQQNFLQLPFPLGDDKSTASPVICPVPSRLQRRVDTLFFTSNPAFDEMASTSMHGLPKMLCMWWHCLFSLFCAEERGHANILSSVVFFLSSHLDLSILSTQQRFGALILFLYLYILG